VAAGATDSLGAVAAAPVAAAPTAKVGTVNLPATGSSSTAPLLWLAFSMLVLGAGLLRRRSA
jgi:LPXTG-motif cell wall-anchored protein